MRLTVAASLGAKVVSVVCTLAQVPLALHLLGPEAYGLWITLMSILIMLNFVDFGLGVGMQKAIATAFGRDDPAQMRRAFFTGALALGILAVVALVVGVPLALAVDWGRLLKIQQPALSAQAGQALAITVAAFAVGLPFNALPRLAMAAQRGWLQAWWIAWSSVGSLVMVYIATLTHWGFLPFLALTAFLPVLQGLGLWWQLQRALGWKHQPLSLLPRAEWRALAGDSLLFSVPQVGLAFVQAAPPLALSLAAGPVAATAYNLLQRLYSPVTQGQQMFLAPLWPAVTEAHVSGDHAWVRRAFNSSLVVALICSLGLIILTWQSASLLHWWLGELAVPATGFLAWLTCGWFVAQVAWQPLMYLLVGVDRLAVLAKWSLAGLGLSLAGMALAIASHSGAQGVLIGAVLGLVLGGLPGLAVAARRALREASPSPLAPSRVP